MFFGAHCSTSGGLHCALERGVKLGCDIVQIFVKNNMQWFGKPLTPHDLALFANQLAGQQLRAVFGHTGYLLNLAAPPCGNREKSLKSLIQEIQRASDLGLPFLVLHPGAHLGAGVEKGLDRIVSGLNEAFAATRSCPVRIALENTAGQGTCLGHRLSHLAEIYQKVKNPSRLGICLDTAHFFAAGYDIRKPKGWESAIQEADQLFGIDQVLAMHLNDSKTSLGSHVDRHAGIGQGEIGLDAFRHIVNDPRFANLPGCLETPKSADAHEDVENLAILRSLTKAKRKKKANRDSH